eukprot:gene27314-biopygen8493
MSTCHEGARDRNRAGIEAVAVLIALERL